MSTGKPLMTSTCLELEGEILVLAPQAPPVGVVKLFVQRYGSPPGSVQDCFFATMFQSFCCYARRSPARLSRGSRQNVAVISYNLFIEAF
jgi:hypothetical protein